VYTTKDAKGIIFSMRGGRPASFWGVATEKGEGKSSAAEQVGHGMEIDLGAKTESGTSRRNSRERRDVKKNGGGKPQDKKKRLRPKTVRCLRFQGLTKKLQRGKKRIPKSEIVWEKQTNAWGV